MSGKPATSASSYIYVVSIECYWYAVALVLILGGYRQAQESYGTLIILNLRSYIVCTWLVFINSVL